MLTIDAQVHAYERDHPDRPWAGALPGPAEMTGDNMVAAMDAVGVDAAILISPFAMYRYDASYALEVRTKHPSKFALIKPVNPRDPAVDEVIADWAAIEGTVAVRLMLNRGAGTDPDDPGIKKVLGSAAQNGQPVNLMCWGLLDHVAGYARSQPNTCLIIDHLGIQQPFDPPPPDNPFSDLAKVLELAAIDNIAIKISGACTYSHKPFPYNDIWDPIRRILDAFGLERCMWGTDWTRAANLVTYAQSVEPFHLTDQLSDSERSELMGGTLQKIYGWRPSLT